MKIPVNSRCFCQPDYNIVNIRVGVMKFFGMKIDGFIRIFQKVGQYRTKCMVIVRGIPIEIKMRQKIHKGSVLAEF